MKTRVGLRTFVGAVCMALAMPAVAALTENLLQNPNFDGTLDPWISFLTTYDPDHSATNDGTGSALASVPDSIGIGVEALVLGQCVGGIVPGATYTLAGRMRIPASGTAAGYGRVEVEWHAASDCSDDPAIGGGTTPSLSVPPGPTDTWQDLVAGVVAPPGAIAAKVYAAVSNGGPLPAGASKNSRQAAVLNFNMSIDDLLLAPTPTPTASVPTLGGAGIAVLVISLAGAAFFFLRR